MHTLLIIKAFNFVLVVGSSNKQLVTLYSYYVHAYFFPVTFQSLAATTYQLAPVLSCCVLCMYRMSLTVLLLPTYTYSYNTIVGFPNLVPDTQTRHIMITRHARQSVSLSVSCRSIYAYYRYYLFHVTCLVILLQLAICARNCCVFVCSLNQELGIAELKYTFIMIFVSIFHESSLKQK